MNNFLSNPVARFLGVAFIFLSSLSQADEIRPYRIYIGGLGGYGSTTWNGLVPDEKNLNIATSLSTPIETEEGGAVWGAFVGYELTPNFALELAYIRYPVARVVFDADSIFSLENDDLTEFSTKTESVSLMGKFMVYVPGTQVRAYSSAGVAAVHRDDIMLNNTHWDPTFGVGLNYHFDSHLMAEIAGNYTAGFGEAQLNPTSTYFPFLYSVSARVAYCFDFT